MLDMNSIVGSHDIVLITLDTLRFDVAQQQMDEGALPVLGRFFEQWEKRHSPGSFTYASHQAIFSGFLPTPIDDPLAQRLMSVEFNGSRSVGKNTRIFNSATIVEGLAEENYLTLCIGGVGFFNKLNPLGCVLPGLFEESYWTEEMGVTSQESTQYQVNKVLSCLQGLSSDMRVFMFLNISAMHQPNYFYRENSPESKTLGDNLESHAAALRYVDSQLQTLFTAFESRQNTLFIICSDHGTCYGEQGYNGHRLAHEKIWTVPYAEFIQEKKI